MELVFTPQVKDLLAQVDTIKEGFATAKETAINDIVTLTQEVADLEAQEKDTYRLYVLGQVELSAYQDAKAQTEAKKEVLAIAKDKVENIDAMQKDELYNEVYSQYESILSGFYAEHRQNEEESKKAMFQAKADYLNAVKQGKEQLDQTKAFYGAMENLAVELGVKRFPIISFSEEVINGLMYNHYSGEAGLDVTRKELHSAFIKGVIPQNVIKKAE